MNSYPSGNLKSINESVCVLMYFQTSDLTLNTSSPDITLCFQNTVVVWTTYGILLLASLMYIPFLAAKDNKNNVADFSLLNAIKIVCIHHVKSRGRIKI